MLDDKLAELKRLAPDGEWESDERTITPGDGKTIECSSEEMSEVELKIVLEFLTAVANALPQLEDDWNWARSNLNIIKRDLDYYKGRSKEWKQRGYVQALDEIIDMLVSRSYPSVNVRDAFQELLKEIELKRWRHHRVKIEESDLGS